MSAIGIYDFEGLVEGACKKSLTDVGVDAFTTYDPITYDKIRPRVELKFNLGAGCSRDVIIVNGVNIALDPSAATGMTPQELFYARRESAWNFSIEFNLLTNADMLAHAGFRATLRLFLATLWNSVNAQLTRHIIQLSRADGDSDVYVSSEKGYFRSKISFSGTISVQADAWSVLTQ